MSAAPVPNWRQLAEAASRESDPAKLLHIVGQLCDSLDKVHTNEHATEPEPPQAIGACFRPEQLTMMDANSKHYFCGNTARFSFAARSGSKESWLSGGQRLQRGRGARKDLLW
jgi:hypothetical protein